MESEVDNVPIADRNTFLWFCLYLRFADIIYSLVLISLVPFGPYDYPVLHGCLAAVVILGTLSVIVAGYYVRRKLQPAATSVSVSAACL